MLSRYRSLRSFMLPLACALATSLGGGCTPGDEPLPAGAETHIERHDVGIDVIRYDLRGEYDWMRGRLVATVDITLSAHGMKSIELDSSVALVKAVRLLGGGALPFSVDTANDKLQVDVSKVHGGGPDMTLEIDYEAAPSDSLFPVGSRKGDPLNVRSLFTMSEPLGAQLWMPCHNTPADRAIFSIDMRMAAAEKMIANGALVADQVNGGKHRMKYETAYTLPTYLMAFAISDFEVESTMSGSVPISIWHRRGLPGDYQAVLGEMVGMMNRFEGLLGPYPFEKYAVVHLPTLPVDGEENAGITFQYEGVGTEPLSLDLDLTAHELAHQWFGDLVTIETWDDVWIKEGMASLLELEPARAHTNAGSPFTLNGDAFYAIEGDAIRDTSLAPDDKYTSGPYGRAGWLLTQIRSVVGEDAFWRTLRGILHKYRFGAIGTDDFLDAFAGALGPHTMSRLKQAVDAKALPMLDIEPLDSGGATVTLHDAEGALVAPFDVAWLAEDGSVRRETLEIDQPFTLASQASGELLVMDPLDRHLTWDYLVSSDTFDTTYQTNVLPLLAPTSSQGVARLLDAGWAAQNEALWVSLPSIPPSGFAAFMAGLDSEQTQASAILPACVAATDPTLDPQTSAAWASVLDDVLSVPPPTYVLDQIQSGGYGACTMFDPVAAFAGEWTQLQTGLPSGGIPYTRLAYLSAFTLPPALAMSTWGSVATQASAARARWLATMTLRGHLYLVPLADRPAWRTFFVDMLSATEDTDVLDQAIRAVVTTRGPSAAANAAGLAGLGVVLHSPWTRTVKSRAVCAAFKLTQGDATAWSAFVAGLQGVTLPPTAAARLADPSLCQ